MEQEKLMNAEQLATEEFEIENIATVNVDNNNDSEFKAVLSSQTTTKTESTYIFL